MYIVKIYSSGQAIGVSDITTDEFAHYHRMAQQPEGIIRLGKLPHDYYDLDDEFQGLPEGTLIYLD